jgi:hypothetical protein
VKSNPDILSADAETVRRVCRCIEEIMSIPAGPLEHAVQLAHDSTARRKDDPPEVFEVEGVSRQALRMFWHFRCNIEAVVGPEDRG